MSKLNLPSGKDIERIENRTFEKCTIVSLDEPDQKIVALFNPNKIKISKNVSWARHASAGSKIDMLEFTGAKNRILSVELFFDGYLYRKKHIDSKAEYDIEHENVEEKYVNKLIAFTTPSVPLLIDEKPRKPETVDFRGGKREIPPQMRPHFIVLVWGKLSRFKGVLESVSAEYSMFASNGCPVRATCSVQIAEVDTLQFLDGDFQFFLAKKDSR